MGAKRRNDVAMPEENSEQISVEATSSEPIHRKKKGVFVPFDANGQLDMRRVRDPEAINAAREALRVSAQPEGAAVAGEVQFITDEHVKMLLGAYMTGCSYVVPGIVNPKFRVQGIPEISHDLATRIYQLTPEQIESLTPDGVAFLNQQFAALPQWLKDWLTAFGPGAKFLGQLGFITAMQTKTLLDEWKRMNMPADMPVNGAAVEKPN